MFEFKILIPIMILVINFGCNSSENSNLKNNEIQSLKIKELANQEKVEKGIEKGIDEIPSDFFATLDERPCQGYYEVCPVSV